jgi:DDE superfamily endonuclease
MMYQQEMLLLMLVMQGLAIEIDDLVEDTESMLAQHIQEQRRLNRSLPEQMKRPSWDQFCSNIATSHFRRMFRMSQELFCKLCVLICGRVGRNIFCLEEDVMKLNWMAKNPPIAGEIKAAISLRMLAGGSYLDLVMLFGVKTSHIYNVFHEFVAWVIKTFQFPLVAWLRERRWSQLEDLANEYAEKTDGIFYGPFGSLDGIAIRVASPKQKEVPDPGNYYCRKGFYALNVQAVCDMRKRFLWCYPTNKGSTHDSIAFVNSRLYDLLFELSEVLRDRELFLVGDTAYGLTSFLQVPFDTAELKHDTNGMRDSFNYHLSSCRIHIECAYGELVMRWGILWRTLLFSLQKCGHIIQACMLLQNFLIDHRDSISAREDSVYFQQFEINSQEAIQLEITRQSGEPPRALVTDNNEPHPPGRPTRLEEEQRRYGLNVRDRLTVKLAAHDLKRPLQQNMNNNSHVHIYFD